MESYVVLGLGRFGRAVAEKLYECGKDVMVIDGDPEHIAIVADKVSRAVTADIKDITVLKSLGVSNCDCAIVAVGHDLSTSVLTTMNLKKLGVPKVVCKARDDTHKEILEKIGADQIVFPEREMAEKLVDNFTMPNILEEIEVSEEFGIIECIAPKSWEGKMIKDTNARIKYGVSIIAAKCGEKVTVSPGADFIIEENSTLLLLGKYDDFEKVNKLK